MSDRIERIDALRGWALLGIAVIHFMEQFLGAMPPPGMASYAQHGLADRLLEGLGFVLIRGKGFAIFSFLFGLSFALQMQHAEARNPEGDFRPRFAWRLVILGIIGWVHGLLYGGDILLIYALLGLPMLVFYRTADRWLLVLGLLLILGAPRALYFVVSPKPAATAIAKAGENRKDEARTHWQRLTRGSIAEVAHANASTALRNKLDFQFGFLARGYQTFGLFLLGLWAGRRRLFENIEENLPAFRRAFHWSVGPALLIAAAVLIGMTYSAFHPRAGGGDGGPPGNMWSWRVVLGITLYDAWNFAFTVFYLAGFVLVSRWARAGRWLLLLAPVGRMALTNYMLQTIFGSFLFMGFGLGLLGTVGNAVTLSIGFGFFSLCAWGSTHWLKAFRFGPMEWLWRSLTLLKVQPFRKHTGTEA